MWTLQDAKNRFSAVVDAALAGQPQQVTRRGKPAVVVVSAAQYDRLRQTAEDRRGSFFQHLLAFPGLDDDPGCPRDRAAAHPREVEF